jgi:hypothetical protein
MRRGRRFCRRPQVAWGRTAGDNTNATSVRGRAVFRRRAVRSDDADRRDARLERSDRTSEGAQPGRREHLVQREVSSPFVVVGDVLLKMTAQGAFVAHDDVVQALASDGADHPFHKRILPGRSRRDQNLLDAHRLRGTPELRIFGRDGKGLRSISRSTPNRA